jgi:hypothetical protein
MASLVGTALETRVTRQEIEVIHAPHSFIFISPATLSHILPKSFLFIIICLKYPPRHFPSNIRRPSCQLSLTFLCLIVSNGATLAPVHH